MNPPLSGQRKCVDWQKITEEDLRYSAETGIGLSARSLKNLSVLLRRHNSVCLPKVVDIISVQSDI